MLRRLRLLVVAAVAGALTGVVSWTFLEALATVTRWRVDHGWLVWCLPLAGITVAASYHRWGGHAKGGTPYVVEQANVLTHGVPARMLPFIWSGSVLGHLTGASVGREGAALQMAGSITDTTARIGRLDDDERRTLVSAALAAGWGGVFGVPFTGVAFALQMRRSHRLRILVPSTIAAVTARAVVGTFDPDFGVRPRLSDVDWTLGLPVALLAVGLSTGLAARLFVRSLHHVRSIVGHRVRHQALRPLVGAALTLALVSVVGREHLGLSTTLTDTAFTGGGADWWDPLLKMVLTVAALGTGFVGGEVLPLFVIGGTLGAALAPTVAAPSILLATTASVAAFSSAAGVVLTGLVLTVEQFGWNSLGPAIVVGIGARIAAGRPGLYATHH